MNEIKLVMSALTELALGLDEDVSGIALECATYSIELDEIAEIRRIALEASEPSVAFYTTT